MPKNNSIKKVLVIGSGPIVIGQAAEFDYAGTQACRSLKEEGIEVVLLNSNPATIMTDKDIADRVYIEPLTVEVVEQLILKEKPDSVLPTLGGQAGLNLAMELITSLVEPMLVPLNTWPSSNIRNAFIQSPFLMSFSFLFYPKSSRLYHSKMLFSTKYEQKKILLC